MHTASTLISGLVAHFGPLFSGLSFRLFTVNILQLKVASVGEATEMDPGARIDPAGHDAYAGKYIHATDLPVSANFCIVVVDTSDDNFATFLQLLLIESPFSCNFWTTIGQQLVNFFLYSVPVFKKF